MYTSYDNLPLTLSVKETAEILGVSTNNVYELLRCDVIHSVRIGNQYRIPKEAIKQYLSV